MKARRERGECIDHSRLGQGTKMRFKYIICILRYMTDINELKRLRDHIENMDSIHQVHIFKILKQNQIEYTENNNGVFINMTLLNHDTLKHIRNFIKYVDLQQKQLESVEDIKAKYQKEFYKDNKENSFG